MTLPTLAALQSVSQPAVAMMLIARWKLLPEYAQAMTMMAWLGTTWQPPP